MLRSLILLFLATAIAQASVTYIIPHYTIREGWRNSIRWSSGQNVPTEAIKVTAFSDQGQFLGVTMYQLEPGFSEVDPSACSLRLASTKAGSPSRRHSKCRVPTNIARSQR